jgi:hypothetical protein
MHSVPTGFLLFAYDSLTFRERTDNVRSPLAVKRTKLRPPLPRKRLPRRVNPPGAPPRPRPKPERPVPAAAPVAKSQRGAPGRCAPSRPHRYELIPDTSALSPPQTCRGHRSIALRVGRRTCRTSMDGCTAGPAPHAYQRARSPRVRNYFSSTRVETGLEVRAGF